MLNFKHLTNEKIKATLKLRSDILFKIRNYFHKNRFVEIQTTILSFPTKEYGEGEFIVFSKLNRGKFYTLPHSPQLYKQILLGTAGDKIKKYYQIALSFRPEVGDNNHVQQFTQIDFEITNPSLTQIIKIIRDIINIAFSFIKIRPKYVYLDYKEAIAKYGTDSPDLRYHLGTFYRTKNLVCFNIKEADILNTKKFIKTIKNVKSVEYTKKNNFYRIWTDKKNYRVLGAIRNKLIEEGFLRINNKWSIVLLKNLPLFIKKEDGTLSSFHHPQMAPMGYQVKRLKLNKLSEDDLLKLNGMGFDLFINGLEVAGGNVRVSDYDLQKQILGIIGVTRKDLDFTYTPLLNFLKNFPSYKSAGAAIGLDRLMLLLTHSSSINEVQPFPMSENGKEFFGGPWKLTSDEILSMGIESEHKILTQSRNVVCEILKNSGNFIHNCQHMLDVEKNILELTRHRNLLPNDEISLRLTAHWHDVGRNDNKEKDNISYRRKSIKLFKKWAIKNKLSHEIINKVVTIIAQYRTHQRKVINELLKIFYDANKLDIFNISRCKNILIAYSIRKNFPNNEFNYIDTFNFWKNINYNFVKEFYTKEAKKIFIDKFPIFKNFVYKNFQKYILDSKKIIAIGGAETISGKFKELDKLIFKMFPKKEKILLYLPIGIFNNKNLIAVMPKYVKKMENYYSKIDKNIKFVSIGPNENNRSIIQKINNANVIYIGGGDTFFLINELKKRKLDEALQKAYNSGKFIIGNSAGALSLLEDTVSICDNKPQYYKGIGLLKNYIFIVHDKNKLRRIKEKLKRKFLRKNIIPLKKENAVFLINGVINKYF